MGVFVVVLYLCVYITDSQNWSPHVNGGRYYWEWVAACSEWSVETQDRYFCTLEGKIECRDGWEWNMCSGPMCAYLETPDTFCNKPKCSEGCDPINGKCEIPNTCNCLNGYEGENCTEIISHPFCKNGVARSAVEPCVCFEGWQGDLCDVPICKEGCSERNGYCVEPDQCLCNLGWKGELCKTCAPYPGCMHGYCDKPWECNCDDGWIGHTCNETISGETHDHSTHEHDNKKKVVVDSQNTEEASNMKDETSPKTEN